MHSIYKYDLLVSPVLIRGEHVECDYVSGTVKDFLHMRDSTCNPVDITNINSILEYLCEV